MFRFPVFAAFCFAAVPAFAQTPSAPAAEANPVAQAGMAFGQCLQAGVGNVPASMTPEAGAASVLSGCAAQRQAVEQAAQTAIAALPEAQRAGAQEQLRTQLGAVEGQLVAGIRQMRQAAAPAPAPAQ